jgi:hypothetical protein
MSHAMLPARAREPQLIAGALSLCILLICTGAVFVASLAPLFV